MADEVADWYRERRVVAGLLFWGDYEVSSVHGSRDGVWMGLLVVFLLRLTMQMRIAIIESGVVVSRTRLMILMFSVSSDSSQSVSEYWCYSRLRH